MNVGARQRVSTRTLLITAALLVAAVAFLPWPLAQRITDSPWSAARAVRLDVSAASLAPSTSTLVHDFAVYPAVLAVAATCLVVAALVMAA